MHKSRVMSLMCVYIYIGFDKWLKMLKNDNNLEKIMESHINLFLHIESKIFLFSTFLAAL